MRKNKISVIVLAVLFALLTVTHFAILVPLASSGEEGTAPLPEGDPGEGVIGIGGNVRYLLIDRQIERKEMQYLYEDGGLYYFMDMETYEQLPIDGSKLSDNFKYVKENEMCKIVSYQGDIFGVEPPTFVVLEIADTEPGVRGDTATGASKTATLETGATIRVPLFVNTGDMIRVDTRTGEYLERA